VGIEAPSKGSGSPLYRAIYAAVHRIPKGRVATYGQIAAVAGFPGRARQVGYALAATPDERVLPWHRVINASGEVSARADGSPMARVQRGLLEAEGVRFDVRGRVDLKRYQWRPR
jgi:methylated-DNA-protein-cysteine methyltransferase related protein